MESRRLDLPWQWSAFATVPLMDELQKMGADAWKWLGDNSSPLQGLGVLILVAGVLWQVITGVPWRWGSRLLQLGPRATGQSTVNIPAPKLTDPRLVKPPGTRSFVNDAVTPGYLMDLRRGTTAQANAATTPYMGKWMRVSGVVSDVSDEHGRGAQVTVPWGAFWDRVAEKVRAGIPYPSAFQTTRDEDQTHGEYDTIHVFLGFDREWHSEVLVLPRGGLITVEGEIGYVDHGALGLKHCRLVTLHDERGRREGTSGLDG